MSGHSLVLPALPPDFCVAQQTLPPFSFDALKSKFRNWPRGAHFLADGELRDSNPVFEAQKLPGALLTWVQPLPAAPNLRCACPTGPSPGLGRQDTPGWWPCASAVSPPGWLGPGSRPGQEAPVPTAFSPSSSQLKAFKDEEKAKEALKQQKRKAKVRRPERRAALTSSRLLQGLQSDGGSRLLRGPLTDGGAGRALSTWYRVSARGTLALIT